jgi:hypothetical protein
VEGNPQDDGPAALLSQAMVSEPSSGHSNLDTEPAALAVTSGTVSAVGQLDAFAASSVVSAGPANVPSSGLSTVGSSLAIASGPANAPGSDLGRPSHAAEAAGSGSSAIDGAISHSLPPSNQAEVFSDTQTVALKVLDGAPSGSDVETDEQPQTGGAVIEPQAIDGGLPSPGHADLLTEFLPFDRASVEGAIDQFLDQFEGLGASLPDLQGVVSLVPAFAAVAATALASEVILRRRRRGLGLKGRTEHDPEEALDRFSRLPNLWNSVEL